MTEFIDKLLDISAGRTLFYAIVFIISLAIVGDTLVGIVKHIFKPKK